METAFCLPSGVTKNFIRNSLWQHYHQQQQQESNQFTSPPITPAISETSSWNALVETEENDFDQRNADLEENSFMSNSYSLLEQVRKKSQNLFQSTSTIQSSISEAESSLDVELFIELIRQFRVIRNPKCSCFKYHAKKGKHLEPN